MEIGREGRRAAPDVLKDEHGDAPGFPVAGRGETHIRPGRSRGRPQLPDDRGELARRAVAEKGERDVQVRARDRAYTAETLALPGLDDVKDVLREPQSKEEPKPRIGGHANGR